MNHTSLTKICSLAILAALVAGAEGCASETGNDEQKLNASDPITYAEGGGGGGYRIGSSAPPPPSGLSAAELQKRATAAFAYALGGAHPYNLYPCSAAGGTTTTVSNYSFQIYSSDALTDALNQWRYYFARQSPAPPHATSTAVGSGAQTSYVLNAGYCRVKGVSPDSRDGLPISRHDIECSGVPARGPNALYTWNDYLRNALNACWPGATYHAADFWEPVVITTTSYDDAHAGYFTYDLAGSLDPEPASLNGSLWANGSSASATYVNSRTATNGYQWPSSWAVGSAPAGAPCATYSATAGTTLYSVIQASGSYRKCM